MVTDYSVYVLSPKEKREYFIAAMIFVSLLLYLYYASAFVILPAALISYLGMGLYADMKARKRRDFLAQQFRDMLYSFSASMAAGRHMKEALAEAADNLSLLYDAESPMILEIREMLRKTESSHESEEIMLRDFGKRSGIKEISTFADVYYICRETGGDLVRVTGITSQMLLDKMTVKREIESYTAQKKFEGRVIAALSPGMIFFLNIMSPGYLEPLYEGTAGRTVMTFSLLAAALGYYITDRITDVGIWNYEDKRVFSIKKRTKEEGSGAEERNCRASGFYEQHSAADERGTRSYAGSEPDHGGRKRFIFLPRASGNRQKDGGD